MASRASSALVSIRVMFKAGVVERGISAPLSKGSGTIPF
jgi:hypothetical protein